jgi:hypothetical protein
MRPRQRLVGIAVVVGLVGGGIAACGALLDLPPLERISDEAGTIPTPGADAPGSDTGIADGPAADASSCTAVTPVAEWCPRCGVGCADGATCTITGQACADGGPACCAGTQCKNGSCQPCSGDGGSCGTCCGELRCRSTDNKCLPCGVVGSSCEALTTGFCCSRNCDIIAGKCR